MNILVTGAKGFVGRNLVAQLKNIGEGRARNYGDLRIDRVFEYDTDSSPAELDEWCAAADFVFNLAGVNRPQDPGEFMQGNFGFASTLLDTLRRHRNTCPVMLASSIQATLVGRYAEGDYGKSKRAGEELFFDYARETGARVLVYRFPELLYIDDLVDEMIAALTGGEHRCEFDGLDAVPAPEGRYCVVPTTHRATLGEIVDLLETFRSQPQTLAVPEIPGGSFAKKLWSTYLSYLPKEKAAFPLKMNRDARGSFTELIRTANCGQVSVNISGPGVTKGEHWHNSKWEFFMVVSGRGLIRMRRIGTDEVLDFEVSGEKIEAVHMLPGYTHNIVNLSDTENLVTVMWANEPFDPARPDTYFEPVET